MAKYKAVVWTDVYKIKVVEKPTPKPGPGKVLLKIKAAGICGTDLHILAGKHPEAKPPLVPGHEFAGVVADVGKGVDKKLIGTRVGSDSYLGCGECKYCLARRPQLCEKGTREIGINVDGGWAEYVVAPRENIYMLPENVDFSLAGAGCILNCPMAAIETVKVEPGDIVLIIGDGPSTLIMIQLARLKGASKVIIAGHREGRLSLALELGADQVINTHSEDLSKLINSLPRKPHVVIDAVGKAETFAMALSLAGREGRIHLFGLPEEPANNIPLHLLLFKELTIVSSTGAPALWQASMDYISRGYIKVAPIISHRFSIDKAPEALEFIMNNPKEIIKAIFEMNGR
ncbi:MAG: alcohol dehydrogenase catalytic domain-containing protein [bacterium]|nr:alcohol dehydrogenase catalytic domain-containing protein [bacterium]